MSAHLVLTRREYKVMLDHRMFAERKAAAADFCRELRATARRLKQIKCDGEFNETKKREITFLDTIDETIRLNRFVFRQRRDLERNRTEYTLKCRSPDRYVARGADVRCAHGLNPDQKLEEDIGAPFVSRFSQSNTVKGTEKPPKNLRQAAAYFPALGTLKRDGERCSDKLDLRPVNSMRAYERVLIGPTLGFENTEAEVALILWSDGAEGRPLVAEFSFRYEHKSEKFSATIAALASEMFEELQRLDWCRPDARTKTQFAYRE